MRRKAQSITATEEAAPPIIEQPTEQLVLPIVAITQPSYSNDLEDDAPNEELMPEVNAGPSFNF
ncbi:MAG TPA: hypothetical protein VI306_09230 [Pyrinomonadaceae bacterium]